VLRDLVVRSSIVMGDHGVSPLGVKMLFTFPLQWLFLVGAVAGTHPLLSVPVPDPLFCFSLADIMQI